MSSFVRRIQRQLAPSNPIPKGMALLTTSAAPRVRTSLKVGALSWA